MKSVWSNNCNFKKREALDKDISTEIWLLEQE